MIFVSFALHNLHSVSSPKPSSELVRFFSIYCLSFSLTRNTSADPMADYKLCDAVKPHASTTPFSRFSSNLSPSWTFLYPGSLSQTVYEARCEVTSTDIAAPIGLCMSLYTTCLAVPCIGYRSHLPLHYLPGEAPRSKFLKGTEPTLDSRISPRDSSRRRAETHPPWWFASSKVISWGKDTSVHTKHSRKFNGPLAVFPKKGRVIRTGLVELLFGIWTISMHTVNAGV